MPYLAWAFSVDRWTRAGRKASNAISMPYIINIHSQLPPVLSSLLSSNSNPQLLMCRPERHLHVRLDIKVQVPF
ncbi:hypothetical protein ACNF0O_16495 [Escherichia coli]